MFHSFSIFRKFSSSKLIKKSINLNNKYSSSLCLSQSPIRCNFKKNNIKNCSKTITTLINYTKLNGSSSSLSLPLLRINITLKRNLSATSRLKKWKITGTKHKGQSFKTRKAVSKRFRVTGKGKLKHAHAGRRHNTGHKSRRRVKLRLAKMNILHGTKMARNIHQMILGRK